jgi:hypothetical protein
MQPGALVRSLGQVRWAAKIERLIPQGFERVGFVRDHKPSFDLTTPDLCCIAIIYLFIKINTSNAGALYKGLNYKKTNRRPFMADLNVNGKKYKVDVDPGTPLFNQWH